MVIMIRRRRNPLIQIILIALASALGIGSRRYAHTLPGFIATYAGDTLWAVAAFLGIGLILPRASTRTIAILAMAFSIAVELSQLYHTLWIDSIRHTTLGGVDPGFRVRVERPGLLRSGSGAGGVGRVHRRNRPKRGADLQRFLDGRHNFPRYETWSDPQRLGPVVSLDRP
jgi:uncharacterized protein DUF2809